MFVPFIDFISNKFFGRFGHCPVVIVNYVWKFLINKLMQRYKYEASKLHFYFCFWFLYRATLRAKYFAFFRVLDFAKVFALEIAKRESFFARNQSYTDEYCPHQTHDVRRTLYGLWNDVKSFWRRVPVDQYKHFL